MTREEKIKSWPTEKFVSWLIKVERNAMRHADDLNNVPDEVLAVDWYEFLAMEDDEWENV